MNYPPVTEIRPVTRIQVNLIFDIFIPKVKVNPCRYQLEKFLGRRQSAKIRLRGIAECRKDFIF
jgi:hypothetical protein